MFKTVEIEGNETKFIVVRILSMTIELVSQPKLIKSWLFGTRTSKIYINKKNKHQIRIIKKKLFIFFLQNWLINKINVSLTYEYNTIQKNLQN